MCCQLLSLQKDFGTGLVGAPCEIGDIIFILYFQFTTSCTRFTSTMNWLRRSYEFFFSLWTDREVMVSRCDCRNRLFPLDRRHQLELLPKLVLSLGCVHFSTDRRIFPYTQLLSARNHNPMVRISLLPIAMDNTSRRNVFGNHSSKCSRASVRYTHETKLSWSIR